MSSLKDLEKVLDSLSLRIFGRSLSESLENGICIVCGDKINYADFKEERDIREYEVTGFCQKCQNKHPFKDNK